MIARRPLLIFSPSLSVYMCLLHSVAYFDIEGQVTDSDIREAVFYHWNAESSGIKVIVADTLSGGDTEACSVTYGNLTSGSGVENDEFHGTQYTVEIFNAPPPGRYYTRTL